MVTQTWHDGCANAGAPTVSACREAKRVLMAQVDIADSVVDVALKRRSPIGRARAATRAYPRAVWLMAFANLVLWTGRGMIIPFTVIFFSQIVGLSASLVGTGIGVSALAGIGFVMLAAGQIDRRGGHPVLMACLLVIAVSTLLYGWSTNIVAFFVATIVLNFAGQLYWPASDATIAAIAGQDRVAEAMAALRVAMALGTGLGGLVGGVIVSGGGVAEYRTLFVASCLTVLVAMLIVWRFVPAVTLHSRGEDGAHGAWRDVVPDRTFLYALAVMFVLVLGYSQVTLSVPAFLREEAGISEGTIGALFTLNTLIVVALQIPIAGRVNRGNLGLLFGLGGSFWALSFAFMLLSDRLGVLAAVAVFLAFTAGELLFMPITAVIPVRLAPVHLRGRYFALSSVTWGGSWAVASLGGGFALDLERPAVLWPIMALVMLLGGAAALRLRGSERLAPPRET
jgi:MFS family permease